MQSASWRAKQQGNREPAAGLPVSCMVCGCGWCQHCAPWAAAARLPSGRTAGGCWLGAVQCLLGGRCWLGHPGCMRGDVQQRGTMHGCAMQAACGQRWDGKACPCREWAA